jgi:chromosome segregation ATPase
MKKNEKMKKIKIVSILVVLLLFITGGIVYADELNGYLDWTGSDELANAQLVITELVSDIVLLDGELQVIEAQVEAWVISEGFTELELDLNGDGTVTLIEKLAVLEATLNSTGGGLADIQLELAAVQAELVEINASLDIIITDNSITVTGLESANDKVLLIENYIAELDAEILWLNTQLDLANSEAEAFEEGVCLALDDLPAGLRGNYETWCPTP